MTEKEVEIEGETYEVVEDEPKEEEKEESLRESLEKAFNEPKEEPKEEESKEEGDNSPREEIPDQQANKKTLDTEDVIPQESPPVSPPESWNVKDREYFSKLPKDIQEVISRREQERDIGVRDKIRELTKKERRYQEIEDVLEGYAQRWALEGKSPAAVLQGLVALEDAYNRDPVNTVAFMLKQKGIDPKLLGQTNNSQAQTSPEIQSLLQRQGQLEAYLAQQDQLAKNQAYQNSLAEVDKFSRSTDSNGKLKYPHFEAVAEDIQELLPIIMKKKPNGSQTEWLQEAYNKAIYSVPEVREKVLAEEQQAKENERQKLQEEKIKKAKKAAVSIKSSGAESEASGPANDDIRSLLIAGFEGRL